MKMTISVVTAFLFLASLCAAAHDNLLPNPVFEEAQGGAPAGWKTHTWGGEADFAHVAAGRNGGKCVRIASERGADAAWFAEVAVDPFATYRLSGFIRTERVNPVSGRGALLNVHNLQPVQTSAVSGTTDWTQVAIEFDTDMQDTVQVNCLLGGWGLATGTAWFDDVKLVQLSKREMKPEVTIDATKTGAPISKYVYGQFIEHLGRCIYGGIWAEMLEDRKFYYGVEAEESPWGTHIQGDGEVEMATEGAYTGEQNARLFPGSGTASIVQMGLAFEKDRAYTGRLVMAASAQAARVKLAVAWGTEREHAVHIDFANLSPGFKTYEFSFTAGGDADPGIFHLMASGPGHVDVGAVSLMPADNVRGMRADTLALLKELDAPVYRWPGGNFVSGYNWRDGIGPRDQRPPRKNPAWKGVEHNDFGADEFMDFCRELGTEPYVVVNSGLGKVEEAVAELQYFNGAADTPMGTLRAEHGHPEPYNVPWWGIGNEMYGDWQLGHMPLEEYVAKHNRFAGAMRAEDPDIKLVGVGATGKWSETMLAECADHMDLLSEHFYCHERKGLLSHVRQIPDAIERKAAAHRQYHATLPSLTDKTIPICMDEWNYWYGEHVYGELGTRYFLKDALGIAAGLHAYFRHSDIMFMANYAQTVNVIGCIKTTGSDAAFATTGLALKLYRAEFGTLPVRVEGGFPLDVTAAWTEDRRALTIGVVNPTEQAQTFPAALEGARLTGPGTKWTLAGPDPMAYNEPGAPPRVTITEDEAPVFIGMLPAAPVSVTLWRYPAEAE